MAEFDDIYKLYFRDVYRFILKLSNNESIAEEITQETFFKALKSIEDFNEKCSIKVWLFQIAKNTLCTHYQKQKRLEPLYDSLTQDEKTLDDLVSDKASAMQIHTVLHNLDEPYKEVFMLRIFGELSFSQIGRIFDKTENWARVTFYRSKKKILDKTGGHYE